MVDEAMKKRLAKILEGAVLSKIAVDMEVTPQAVNNWKNKGFITTENGFKLARLRGYNPEWLLTGFGPEKSPGRKVENLDIKRISEILDAISREEKKARIELSPIQRAGYINELYCDQRLRSQPDILKRTAEIIQLTQRR